MKRNLFTLLALFTAALAARAQYQFPNSDFEEDFVVSYVSKSYTEPLGWHGYGTISGAVGSMGRSGEKLCQSTDVRSGSTSTKSAYVKSTSILGIVANGVMTNGQIYSNSLSATDGTGNYNFSDPTNTGDADTYGEENNQFYTPFTGRPDSMRVWLKFLPASSGTGNARVSVYLHKANTVMYDPTDNVTDESIIVAHAEQGIPGSDGWVQYTLPFDYDNDGTLGYSGSVRPGLILATFTTNETPGEGSANDYLYIDDIEMVYNSELEGATYAGEDIVFTGNAASVNTLYSSKLLKCTTTGAGASVEKAEPTKDNGYTLTLTVKGDNISEDATNQNTYTIQFAGILEENFENDEVTVPEIVSSTLEDITDDTRLYLYNSYVGGYLNSDNTLLVSPEKYWKVNQTDGTVISEADTYLRIDRDSYSKEFDSSLVPVTSNQTSFGDGMEFTFSQGEGFVEMYRSKMKYYDSEAVIFSTKYYSNVFAGAESMTKLTSYYTGKDTYEETSGVENTKWMLVSPALYLAYYFSCKAETATLKEGVSFNLAVFSDQFDDDVTTMNIGQMPAGIYGFDNGDTFYYDGENTLTISSDATALTYYGILDLRPTITYNGQQAQEEYETAFDESLLTVKATGNGSESPTVYYDPDTYTLTVIVEGYGKANSTVIQFAAPDLSLSATWDGEAIEDGAVLYASYDASKLALTAGEGATVNSLYDEATGVLTIT
ncbi:MAG: PCMD domain-containing protein, partial [Prevotellaceae bacterium]|nr:PCMD domain-containing protein [Prevotellaceae bacterium]